MKILAKKKLLFVISFFFAAPNFAQTKTVLSGVIPGLDLGSELKIESVSSNGITDSITVSNDSFHFALSIEKGDLYFITYVAGNTPFAQDVYLQKGSDVHLQFSKNLRHLTFTGSDIADVQNNFRQGLEKLSEPVFLHDKKRLETTDSATINQIETQQKKEKQKEDNFYIEWVKQHTHSPVSVGVIYLYTQEINSSVRESLFNALSDEAKKNNAITDLLPYSFARSRSNEALTVGKKMKDFTLQDTSGNKQSFSKLNRDNYVLIDIWASWCDPCRKSVPGIKKVLNTYYDKNLRVIGISADNDGKLWKDAIREDNAIWYQLSDLQGTDQGFMKENNIFEYPTYLIVAPDGTIISKPVTIERVQERLADLFGKKKDGIN